MSKHEKKGALISSTFIVFLKERRNLALLLLALVGAVLVFSSALGFGSGSTASGSSERVTLDEYKRSLEEELSSLCSRVSGAGRCVVSVSFSEGERLEYKGTSVVSSTPPKVSGVTVLALGGGADAVKREISELISALYGIGHNRICVLKLSS